MIDIVNVPTSLASCLLAYYTLSLYCSAIFKL